MQTTLPIESVTDHLLEGMRRELYQQLRSKIQSEAEDMVAIIAHQLCGDLMLKISAWTQYDRDQIQISLNIDGVAKFKESEDK